MIDYAEPLLEMRKMLRELEEFLMARQWREAMLMAAPLNTQLRFLNQTVRLQAEDNLE
jgi:hypothetical protein